MKISIFGSGYVGLVAAACFSDLGNDVVGVDINQEKVDTLNSGKSPIYEPGLEEKLLFNMKQNRLSFTTDIESAVKSGEVIFIAVGTPQEESGKAHLDQVFAVGRAIGRHINSYKVVVNKSTVPVGTASKVERTILDEMRRSGENPHYEVDVVSNPEFLKEGDAIKDFMIPDRIVVGANSERARSVMESLYKGIERTGRPILFTDVTSAELIKYASNAMLASRVSFMNMLSELCDKVGGDITQVAKGMGLDSRIGSKFLHAGAGYGGSCFPKDVQALIYTMNEYGCNPGLLEAVESINERQKLLIPRQIMENVGDVAGRKIAVWGLAFKPKTDDMREAPSLKMIDFLYDRGASISAFDPVAEDNARLLLKGKDIEFVQNQYDALKRADALVICTEWDQFRNPDFQRMKSLMRHLLVFDGRNIYNPAEMEQMGFSYYSIGRNRAGTKG